MIGIPVRPVHAGLIPAAITTTILAGVMGVRSTPRAPAMRWAPTQPSTTFAYAPGTRRYQLTTVYSRSQNQAGGRAPFEFNTTTTEDVTVTLTRRSRDTLAITLTVDTVAVTSDLDAPPANVSGYKGAKLAGLISPQGKIYRFDPPANAAEPVPQLYRAFRRFLVPFPSGELALGKAWSDTTTTQVKVAGYDTKTVAIMNSTIAGDTTYAGHRAWRIDRTGTIDIAGTTTARTDTVGVTGDGTVRATDYVAMDGVFLGNTSTQTNRIQQYKPNEPGVQGVPIQQTFKSTVKGI